MATRAFLFMDQTEGFATEAATTDDTQLGKIVLGGVGGIGIDLGSTRLINVAIPSVGTDVASKDYVDSVAQGLSVKGSVHAVSTANIAALTGAPVSIDSTSVAAGERVLLTGQTAVPWSGTGDSLTFATGVVTLATTGGTFATTDVGKKIIVTGATDPNNNGTFVIASRVDVNTITFANASGSTETSSFAFTGEAGLTNGIWVVQSGAWTRPLDFAASADEAGAFTFVQHGTLWADTGWVCTNNYPNDVVGSDGLTFTQFSAAGIIDAGAGLKKIGNTISVKKGDGIEIVSNTGATNIDLAATNPGLALTGTSPNKKLSAAVVATGGVQIEATGLSLLLETSPNATLGTSATGVKVLGVPSLFTIAGSAVSANVTHTNLNTLTAGSSSNADALHTHAGAENALAVVEAVAKGDPVYVSTATADRVGKGDAGTTAKARIIGIAEAAQPTPPGTTVVISSGLCHGVLTGMPSLAQGDPIYLKDGGGLSRTMPGAGKRVIEVGFAMNMDDLWVRIVDYGKKAA